MAIWHRIKHALGWQRGDIVSVTWNGCIWMGYRCRECGAVTHKTPAGRVPADEAFR